MSLYLKKDKTIISDYYGAKKVIEYDDILKVAIVDGIAEIDGWTVEDMLELIKPLGGVWGELAWCDFEVFYEEMKKPIGDLDKDSIEHIQKIKHIRIGRIIEQYEDGEVVESFDATGIGIDGERYALDFSPINSLKHLPIVVSDEFEIRKLYQNPQEPPLFKGKKSLCLMDVIWALLWEISFHGTPENRDEQAKELKRRVEEIDNGTEKLIPAEEVFREMRKIIDEKEDGDKDENVGKFKDLL
jgi:hypothetical protein